MRHERRALPALRVRKDTQLWTGSNWAGLLYNREPSPRIGRLGQDMSLLAIDTEEPAVRGAEFMGRRMMCFRL